MPTRIVEGRQAPDFSREDAGGKRVSPADFKGKDVIVYFYPKDDTPGWTKEACGFRDAWKESSVVEGAAFPLCWMSLRMP